MGLLSRFFMFFRYIVILPVIFLIGLPSQAEAFINVESIRQIGGEGFVGRTGLQVTGQEGNTNKFTSQFSILNAYRRDGNEWIFTGSYKYGESAYQKDTNQGSVHLRHTWKYLEPLAYEAFVQSGFNEFQELNSRNYLGGNLRFHILKTGSNQLYLGTGVFYEIEDFSTEEDHQGFRGNLYLSYIKKLNELISGSAILYYQPRFEKLADYRIRAQFGIDVRLTSSLILDLDLNVSHNTGLPPDVKKTDLDYLIGFSLIF